MSLSTDLRLQAQQLAQHEPKRPRQASLRRAVSALYYAQFHLLIDEAAKQMLGAAPRDRRLRQCMARAFDHTAMAKACRSFAGGNLPATIAQTTSPLPLPADLQLVANTFVRLQEKRHRADYDLRPTFTRADVAVLLRSYDDALAAWRRVRGDPAARFFLICLPLWSHLQC
ncbi:MAG: hypothetical protein HYU66_29635 [Armatimonadetes bacterium]|nr:hypothetical protein [Armatimonadota bacterium]